MEQLIEYIQRFVNLVINAGFGLVLNSFVGLLFILVGISIIGREFKIGTGTEVAMGEGVTVSRPVGFAKALMSTVVSFVLLGLFFYLDSWFKIIPSFMYFAGWATLYRHITQKGYISILFDDLIHISPFIVGFCLIFNVFSQEQIAQIFLRLIQMIPTTGG